MKQKLLNFLLLTVAMVMGSSGAWADITPFSESYSSTSTTTGWSTGTAGRFTPAILESGGNYFLSVDQGTRNNNGATVKGTIIAGKAAAGDAFTLMFDMRLSSSTNQTNTEFKILDASGSANLLSLKETGTWATTWKLNGTNTIITLPNSNKGGGSNTIADVTWCSYKLTFSDGITYLTITNKENSETIFERQVISGGSTNGGLGNIQFISSRYLANFAIDNIVVREVQDGDIPALPTYTIKYVDSSNNELKTARLNVGAAGSYATITDADKVAIYANDKKYLYVSDDAANKTISAEGTTVVTISFREAATYTYAINAKSGTTTLKSLASGSFFEGDGQTVGWSKYIFANDKWYVTDSPFAETITTTTTKDVNYSESGISDFFEYEELTNSRTYGSLENATCSNNKGFGLYAGANSVTPALALPGYYTMTLKAIVRNANKTQTLSIQAIKESETYGTATELEHSSNTGEYTSNTFFVPEGYGIKITDLTNGNNNSYYDYIYFTRTGEAPLLGKYATKDEMTGVLSGDSISAVINGNILTLTSLIEGYGFEKVKLNMSIGTATANTGIVSNGNVWTGNTKQLVLTLSDGAQLNSIVINDGETPELTTVTTIADFKAAQGEAKLQLAGAEVLWSSEDNTETFVQDATGGISINGISISSAQPGKVVNGTLAAKPEQTSLISGDQTDYTVLTTADGEATVYNIDNVEEALTIANSYRLIMLKGLTISEQKGTFYATDKSNQTIKISNFLFEDVNESLEDGDILATLTGVTRLDGQTNEICPRSANDIVSGLVWNAEDMAAGQQLPIDMSTDNVLAKIAEVEIEAGDVISLNIMAAQEGTIDVQTAAEKSIFSTTVADAGTLEIPVTADVAREILKHGLLLKGNGVTADYAIVEKAKYTADEVESAIWLGTPAEPITLGEAHFSDVREGDVVTLTGEATMTAGETAITSGEELTANQAAALLDNKLAISTVNIVMVTLTGDERHDKAEVEENPDGTYNNPQQGEMMVFDGQTGVDGMIMTYGGNDPEGNEYEYQEVYPEVNKFGSMTEGIGMAPVDNEGNAYDPEKKNVPTQGTFYKFEPTKSGKLELTVGMEKNKMLILTEDGELFKSDKRAADYDGKIGPFEVKATKTYYLFATDSNLKFYGFTFTPDAEATANTAKDIATFKMLAEGGADTLMLNNAVVTYIKGDNVFVEDASGAIDFYQTQIQFYKGQVLNGCIVGNSVIEDNMPMLKRVDGKTKYTTFKVTSTVTPEATAMGIADTNEESNLERFVKMENIKATTNRQGFKILTDGENTIRIQDHFNVFYELNDTVKSIEGIIGKDKEGTIMLWPTSKDGVVSTKTVIPEEPEPQAPIVTLYTLDFTTNTYESNPTITVGEKVGKAYETGNNKMQDIYVATEPAEIAGKIAFQMVSNGVSNTKGWWIRSDKGGLWTWNAPRSAAVLNLKAGNKVIFTCTDNAENVMTLTNGNGDPDGPFTYELSEDGKQYICTMTEDGNVGFCGNKSKGYIATIEVLGEAQKVKKTLLKYDFETGNSSDYFALNNESKLVEPTAEGSTGKAASVVASKDRGDWVKTEADFTDVEEYTIEMDLLPRKTPKTTQFAVLSQSSWDKWTNNYGLFWKTNAGQEHNAFLFNWNADEESNTASINIDNNGTEAVYSGVEWTFTDNTWYHLTLEVNANASTVKYTLAPKAEGSEEAAITGTYQLPEGESPYIKGIYQRNGRYNYDPGAIAIDNVEIYTYVYGTAEEPQQPEEPERPTYNVAAQLAHTAAVQGGSNEASTSLDAETHYYNNWGTAGWVAQAYAGFTMSIPEGGEIKSAELTFTSYCGGSKDGRNVEVYYKDGTDFNYEALELIAATAAGTMITSKTDNLTESTKVIDVTNAVKTIAEAGSNNILFAFGGAAAGAWIYGKASEKAPTLTITLFGEGPATGIEEVTTARFYEDGAVYNLRGQKVGNSTEGLKKGLYVVNGKKVVIR